MIITILSRIIGIVLLAIVAIVSSVFYPPLFFVWLALVGLVLLTIRRT